MAVKFKGKMVPGMVGAFSFAMTVHALYNLLASADKIYQYCGFVVPYIGLFVVYMLKDRIYEWK